MKILAKELQVGDKLGLAEVLEVAHLEGPMREYHEGPMNFGMRPAWSVVLLKCGQSLPSEPGFMGVGRSYTKVYNDWMQGEAEVEVEREEE